MKVAEKAEKVMRRSVWLLVVCAVLAGCGGDSASLGGGGSAAGGTSTGSSGALNSGEVKPASDATYIGATMELTTLGGTSQTNGIITGGMTSGRITYPDTPQFSVSYSASSGYRLSDTINTATFGSAQLKGDTTQPNGNGVVFFTNTSGTAADYLALYQATTYSSTTKGMGYTTARYGGVGGWQHTVGSGASGQTRLDYFAYGPATPVAAMPTSGVVRFSALSSGNYASDTDLWFLSSLSGVYLTVDFGARTISGKLSLGGQNFYKNAVGGIGSIPIEGSFTGNGASVPFSFGILEASSTTPGQFRLLFIGPNANELILTYTARDGARAAVGAAVAVRDPYIF